MANDNHGEKPLNRRQLAKIRTREKVLDAGLKLFKEGSYELATIRDIAKGAGMSTGAVFANFEDKKDLLLACVHRELESYDGLLRAAAQEEGTVLDRVVRVCVADFEFFSERLCLLEALAVLETDGSDEKNRNARALTGRRREHLWRVIETTLRESRCGTAQQVCVISECIMSMHFDRCRYQAIRDCKPRAYRQAFKDLLSHLFAAYRMGLAA